MPPRPALITFHNSSYTSLIDSTSVVPLIPHPGLGLPHLPRDVIPAPQLVAEALSFRIDDQAAHAAQGLGGQELDLCLGVIGLHQTGRMDLRTVPALGGQRGGVGRNGAQCQTKIALPLWEV